MSLFWIILNFIILSFLIIICLLGQFYRHISFGWGLGDILGYFILYGMTLLHLILTIYFWKKGIFQYKYLATGFLIFSILISLKATIWRSNEYSWNGSIFYLPCPTKIAIQNQRIEKELLITMCSMTYFSEFTGSWNGKEMRDILGEIKIPKKLQKYISYPIESILIQLDGRSQINDNPLKLNKEYILTGEIIKVVNEKPLFKVRVKDAE